MNLTDILQSDNLVVDLDDAGLRDMQRQVLDQYGQDEQSMGGYLKKHKKALELARMDSSKVETKLKGGAKVMMPYIMEAAIDFNSRVVMEVLSRDDIVFADIKGPAGDEKEKRARRVTEFANYEVEKSLWKRITDKEMMALPVVGTTYKKTWWDDVRGTLCTGLVMADEVIFSQEVDCFEDAPQVTHKLQISRNRIVSMERAELWDVDVDKLDKGKTEFDFCEVYFTYDLDDDGYAEPYIGMYCQELDALVRVVPNFEMEDVTLNLQGEVVDIKPTAYLTQKQLIPDPEGSPMGLGFGILLHDMFHTINTNTRQMIDAGTLANMASNSGLIAHGVQPRGNQASQFQTGEVEMELGVFKQVQVAGGNSLRDSVMQFPFAGPNATLYQMMVHLEEAARRMTVAGQQVEANANEAASLYLARLQQALKAPNAMIWRVCEGFKSEFKAMFRLLFLHGDDKQYQYVVDEEASLREDFNPDDCDIAPTLNPSQGSDWERLARAEAVLQAAQGNPQMHNVRYAYEQYYKAMGVPDIDQLLPEPDPNAVDPMQQLQLQYAQMEAEFKDREMAVKEGKLALDQMKAVGEMRQQLASMQVDAEKADADRVKTLTEAMKNLAQIADMEEAKAMRTLEILNSGAANGRQLPTDQPGRNTPMAGGSNNPGVPQNPGMVPGPAGGRAT